MVGKVYKGRLVGNNEIFKMSHRYKFKVGEIVRHKIRKDNLVVIKILPKNFFRKENHYICSYGGNPEKLKEENRSDYLDYYEGELIAK